MKTTSKVSVGTRLPPDTLERARSAAYMLHKTLEQVIAEALDAYADRVESETGRKLAIRERIEP